MGQQMSARDKKLWAEYLESKLSPVERAKLKLQKSAKHAMSQRSVTKRRKTAAPSFSTAELGTPLTVSLWRKGAKRPKIIGCYYRLRDHDLEITTHIQIDSWRQWPRPGSGHTAMRSYHRRGTHLCCVEVFKKIGCTEIDGGIVGLKDRLEAIGLVRISPKKLERDSAIHTLHYARDGAYDVLVGMKLDKNGEPVWLGQYEDNEENADFVECQYNQTSIDANGSDFIGLRVVFRFKTGMAPIVEETR
jgi:hypothetical protein